MYNMEDDGLAHMILSEYYHSWSCEEQKKAL